MFHPHWREQALARLDETFDLVVIGGGISGCGILMDAAQRGLRVLLLEQGDIAFGTSSRSSKLIHGGLRYLKQMQFRITRLACQERDRMLTLNPELVRPIRFLYPVMEDEGVPGWAVDLGLWMYDRLTRRKEEHVHLTLDEVHDVAPSLRRDCMQEGLAYTDAVADDAHLTLAVAGTGFAYGGLVLTRARVRQATAPGDGRIDGVVFEDLESGRSHRVRAHVVVNASGVWVDRIRDQCGLEGRRTRPSRGSHIILPRGRLVLEGAVTVPSPDDGRPVFMIPHPDGVLVGTTDIYHEGSLDDPRPTREEVSYLLRALQSYFLDSEFGEQDVVATFAGLRPILDTHAETPSEASREEDVWEERGMLSVAGGKLTTWRSTAEEAVDEALKYLPEERAGQAAPCHTHGTPLVGLAPADLGERIRLGTSASPPVAEALARRLRGFAWPALRLARDEKELMPILDGSDLCAAEVRAHLVLGGVLHLEDLLLRRARVGVWEPGLAPELAARLRPFFEEELGWGRARGESEQTRLAGALEGWTLAGAR
jgi:glycerol-3-phosphate dehydrogenase